MLYFKHLRKACRVWLHLLSLIFAHFHLVLLRPESVALALQLPQLRVEHFLGVLAVDVDEVLVTVHQHLCKVLILIIVLNLHDIASDDLYVLEAASLARRASALRRLGAFCSAVPAGRNRLQRRVTAQILASISGNEVLKPLY